MAMQTATSFQSCSHRIFPSPQGEGSIEVPAEAVRVQSLKVHGDEMVAVVVIITVIEEVTQGPDPLFAIQNPNRKPF